MEKSKIFEREISLIKDKNIQRICHDYFNHTVPSYFWEVGASSSGKYHPQFSQGEGGCNVCRRAFENVTMVVYA